MLVTAEEAGLSGAQSCLAEGPECCSSIAWFQALCMPAHQPKSTPRYEWESIVFMAQHPAREPVAFMNGNMWSLVHSIKWTAGWEALGCSHRRRLHLSRYVVRRLILQPQRWGCFSHGCLVLLVWGSGDLSCLKFEDYIDKLWKARCRTTANSHRC